MPADPALAVGPAAGSGADPGAGSETEAATGADNWRRAGFGLYVHWPFCLSKCPYCDFNSHVAAEVDQQVFVTAYQSQIAAFAALTPGRRLSSIFFGGGTPSLMAPATVEAILAAARRGWSFANGIEITLEANPTSVEAARFDGYRAAGVNRLSLGVQALSDPDLRALGRLHTADEALRALELAQARFGRVSLDLIYARQHQSPEAWAAELARALALGTEHLSLYQLTIEDGTAFGARHRRGLLRGLPDEDRAVALWEVTHSLTEAAGRPGYEVSNHAAPGAESRHNLTYWRGGDWAGVGPGAHGRLGLDAGRLATVAPRLPADWLAACAQGAGFVAEALTAAESGEEYLMMGLRLREGISLAQLRALGVGIRPGALETLCEQGLVASDGIRLRATGRGRLLLNSVLAVLLA